MTLKKEVKGDIVTYSRQKVAGDRKALLKALKQLAKSGDPEGAHSMAESALLEYLNDEELRRAYDEVPKWYA